MCYLFARVPVVDRQVNTGEAVAVTVWSVERRRYVMDRKEGLASTNPAGHARVPGTHKTGVRVDG